MSDTIYTVVSGDTATKITKKFNISLDVFKKLNPAIKDVNKLSIDQKVKVGEVTNIFWSYGAEKIKLNEKSRFYVDMNLHIETLGRFVNDTASIEIELPDGTTMQENILIGVDGKGLKMEIFKDKDILVIGGEI